MPLDSSIVVHGLFSEEEPDMSIVIRLKDDNKGDGSFVIDYGLMPSSELIHLIMPGALPDMRLHTPEPTSIDHNLDEGKLH